MESILREVDAYDKSKPKYIGIKWPVCINDERFQECFIFIICSLYIYCLT